MKSTKKKDSKKNSIKSLREPSSKKKEMPLMLRRKCSMNMNKNVLWNKRGAIRQPCKLRKKRTRSDIQR